MYDLSHKFVSVFLFKFVVYLRMSLNTIKVPHF